MKASTPELSGLGARGTCAGAAVLTAGVCVGLMPLGAGGAGLTHVVVPLLLHPLLWLAASVALLGARGAVVRRRVWRGLVAFALAGVALARLLPIV